MKEYVITDTEFNSTSNRAIQISAVRIRDGLHIADQFNRFIPSPDKFDQLHIIRKSTIAIKSEMRLTNVRSSRFKHRNRVLPIQVSTSVYPLDKREHGQTQHTWRQH
ncbi:DNA polymerase III, epsilon subunit related 3'-5' exonuclease [Lacticaseibacillus paracasei subsp. paracasei Lpp48]|nr:DNA polymerase III, epsilon subunit related 3'-5' exonuclease [Lacticaseibacillus paracasei subsp. paracasei Lpp48]